MCVRGDETQRRVSLDLTYLWAAHDRVLPEVVGHVDGVEAGCFGRFNYLGQL